MVSKVTYFCTPEASRHWEKTQPRYNIGNKFSNYDTVYKNSNTLYYYEEVSKEMKAALDKDSKGRF